MSDVELILSIAEMAGAPEVDLHGYDAPAAEVAVDALLARAFEAREEAVRIIHGKGTGVLRETVHRTLGSHALVLAFRDSMNPDEQGGITYAAVAIQTV